MPTTPAQLAKFYTKLAKNNNGFKFNERDSEHYTLDGPDLGSPSIDAYTVNPKQNIIDFSQCIYSRIDMQFSNSPIAFDEKTRIGNLKNIHNRKPNFPYEPYNNCEYKYCRPRFNKWMYHEEGEDCPIPEGFKFDVQTTGGTVCDGMTNVNLAAWKGNIARPTTIRAYCITGKADGWFYPWERNDG